MNLAERIEYVPFASLKHLDVNFEKEIRTLWCYMHGEPRPCFTPSLLSSSKTLQQQVITAKSHNNIELDYMILGSAVPGVFNLGGDLNLFQNLIESRDEEGLKKYATSCIDVLYMNAVNFNQPITTIALVQGSALGGGFEAALSCSVLIAERGSELGLPEILFNLFPGMGAYSLLSRRIGMSMAERIITSGRLYKAEELAEIGVVDILAEKGKGEIAVRDYIRRRQRASNGFAAIQKVRDYIQPVSYEELMGIADIWVDTALRLGKKDLRVMKRLVYSQDKNKSTVKDTSKDTSIVHSGLAKYEPTIPCFN